MTDKLIQDLDNKLDQVLQQLAQLQSELASCQRENVALKLDKERFAQKMQQLSSLFDVLDLEGHADRLTLIEEEAVAVV
jgi:regulator of replication initiation timing